VSASGGISRLGSQDPNMCKYCGENCDKGFYLLNSIQNIEFSRKTIPNYSLIFK